MWEIRTSPQTRNSSNSSLPTMITPSQKRTNISWLRLIQSGTALCFNTETRSQSRKILYPWSHLRSHWTKVWQIRGHRVRLRCMISRRIGQTECYRPKMERTLWDLILNCVECCSRIRNSNQRRLDFPKRTNDCQQWVSLRSPGNQMQRH